MIALLGWSGLAFVAGLAIALVALAYCPAHEVDQTHPWKLADSVVVSGFLLSFLSGLVWLGTFGALLLIALGGAL